MTTNTGTITGLYRYAVKGLSPDSLDSVHIRNANEAFPDDRRFALMYDENLDKWSEESPKWIHKENFLCVFTKPKFLAQVEASYQIVQPSSSSSSGVDDIESYGSPCDYQTDDNNIHETKRLLTIRDRKNQETIFGPEDLATEQGRSHLSDFFSKRSGGQDVKCVSADKKHSIQKHHFGNTVLGQNKRKDIRVVHLVNANTVQIVADALQVSLHPTRFRPNIIVEGWEPWSEFDHIGKSIEVVKSSRHDQGEEPKTVKLSILAKAVRCEGIGVDPLDPDTGVLDMPALLAKHFPQHGPYLGVYAVIEEPGALSVGDVISLT